MTINKIVCIGALVAALSGCGDATTKKNTQVPASITIDQVAEKADAIVQVRGVPTACTYSAGHSREDAGIAIVLRAGDKRVVCIYDGARISSAQTLQYVSGNILKLAALVQDDMRDGGKEIVVEGTYYNEELSINKAWVQGYEVKLRK
ncbi:hypothetical protein HY642_02810 [Candidatus Woesearchaeota archaeon]|nr:hypothetical protein [Candidatus Woesearchaeota archaeon]